MINEQFVAVTQKFKGLKLERRDDGVAVISGKLHFSATYEGECIEDAYIVELYVPTKYPTELPIVKETGGRVPLDFHRNDIGTLCLGAPLQIKMKFCDNSTLLGFIEEQIIPYLYSYSYFEKHGRMPFGELAHGGKGIVQYYQQFLKIQTKVVVLGFLRILIDDDYRGHHDCPCGSGGNLRSCHGKLLLEIKEHQSRDEFAAEYLHVVKYLVESEIDIPGLHMSKYLRKKLRKSKYIFPRI